MKTIRAFVIEADYYTSDSLRLFLSQDPRTRYVGGVNRMVEARARLLSLSARDKPDVILIGMRPTSTGGQETLDALRLLPVINRLSDTGKLNAKILCLSLSLQPDLVKAAIKCGAAGYLDKNQVAEGIVDAIVLVHTGHCVISPNVGATITESLEKIGKSNVVVFPDRRLRNFGRRAQEVSYLYFRAGLSANEIAEKLDIAENTVRSHIKNIKTVLGTRSKAEAIREFTQRAKSDTDNGHDLIDNSW